MEEKDLAAFGQNLLKSRSESEQKATLLFSIDLCVSQSKVINTDSCCEICVKTLPVEWMASICSGITGPVGGKHPAWWPHGTVGKSPPGLQETGIPVPFPQCLGQLCDLEKTPHKTYLITSAHSLGLSGQLLLQCRQYRNKRQTHQVCECHAAGECS